MAFPLVSNSSSYSSLFTSLRVARPKSVFPNTNKLTYTEGRKVLSGGWKKNQKAEVALNCLTRDEEEETVYENEKSLDERIESGEFSQRKSKKSLVSRELREFIASFGPLGKYVSLQLVNIERNRKIKERSSMPIAIGSLQTMMGMPFFQVLYSLFKVYGVIFNLKFGPKNFYIVSDAAIAKEILVKKVDSFSKGILAEILEFVMGQGLIPADGEIWQTRRRAIVPAIHRKYVERMVDMFVDMTDKGVDVLEKSKSDKGIEMENFFSKLSLDIIGKAVFNYNFDCIESDNPVIKAPY